jgi:hypothetical protein
VGREITGIYLIAPASLKIYQTENLQQPGYSVAAAVLRAAIKVTDHSSVFISPQQEPDPPDYFLKCKASLLL